MDTPLFICTEEEQQAVICLLWSLSVQVLKCVEGYHCNMGMVLCHNRVSTNGLRGSKMVAQTSSMRKEPDQQLKEMKICCPTQHFNVVSHSATCANLCEPSSGTSFYNSIKT